MLSNDDLERLIAEKRREIEKEKIVLGLSQPTDVYQIQDAEDDVHSKSKKTVKIASRPGQHGRQEDEKEAVTELPPDLERYIRRYLGLPVMLKAGEYSPNNPLVRAPRPAGDVLLGLGEYERRRNTLRKLQQQQYREYLDQQAKLKKEAKEKAERERKEREEKERQREEERERTRQQLEEERERARQETEQRRSRVCYVPDSFSNGVQGHTGRKVDTGVQVGTRPLSVAVQTDDGELYTLSNSPSKFQLTQAERELSPRTVVDNDERPIQPASWSKSNWTQQHEGEKQAKSWNRDIEGAKNSKINWDQNHDGDKQIKSSWDLESKTWSSKKVSENLSKVDSNCKNDDCVNWNTQHASDKNRSSNDGPNWGSQHDGDMQVRRRWGSQHDDKQTNDLGSQHEVKNGDINWNREQNAARRRSYGDFDVSERSTSVVKKSSRGSLRHSYMPSIFDADAIHLRNLQAEKEAAERRQFYQQELKNQILEQQRIREERKTREKMLELAEMRRLEEQLRMLRMAQEKETGKQREIAAAIKENTSEFAKKRTTLQKEIDFEQRKLRPKCYTAVSDITKLPHFSYDTSKLRHYTPTEGKRPPFSTNIPDNSIFSPNYDVDSYLRKNLNPKRETLMNLDFNRDAVGFNRGRVDQEQDNLELNSDLDRKWGPVDQQRRNKVGQDWDKVDQNWDKVDHNLDKVDPEWAKTDRKVNKQSEIVILEKALIHEQPKQKDKRYEPSCMRNLETQDDTPIPVLRHSPKSSNSNNDVIEGTTDDVIEGMKLVENKWKVPAVQKNILKSLPNEEGKNVSILTQLGSIRRQLQLEQLRLDNMMSKSD